MKRRLGWVVLWLLGCGEFSNVSEPLDAGIEALDAPPEAGALDVTVTRDGGSGGDAGDGGRDAAVDAVDTDRGASGDAGPSDPCAAADQGDGVYCAASLGLPPSDVLYTCVGRARTATVRCEAGCAARPPGVPDGCNPAPSADPCAGASLGNGGYCGSSLGAGDPNTLYDCQSRVTARATACPHGCTMQPPGVPDRCAAPPTSDPCARATSGNGAYCAASLGAGDPNTLYDCQNRVTAGATRCPYGCTVQPPGVPDRCAAAPSTGGGFRLPFACGSRVTVTQGNNTSFSHNGTQSWAYDFGVGRGTPVLAIEAGTVRRTSSAVTPGSPCWNGGGSSCANTVNYVVIEHDDGTSALYLHLDAAEAAVGARVTRGQRIARSGNTGWSTGPHLHLQRQGRCASWFCASVSLTFGDVGMPRSGATVTSGNCM
ncbi:MAG: peptidoglycan DD-metalloendopeptidase family protein [Myxococcales bacterium]|nr:peptidoglycan DD-metalloendopeptidase family protein [Myxococcales bacterium]